VIERYQHTFGGAAYDLMFGEPDRGWFLLVWLHRGGSGGSAIRFVHGATIHASYLEEKMGIEHDHAVALIDFLWEHNVFVCADGKLYRRGGPWSPNTSPA
jgi:hypothetical protein